MCTGVIFNYAPESFQNDEKYNFKNFFSSINYHMFFSSIYWKQLGAEIYLKSMMLDKNIQISDSLTLFSNLNAAKSTSGIRKHA